MKSLFFHFLRKIIKLLLNKIACAVQYSGIPFKNESQARCVQRFYKGKEPHFMENMIKQSFMHNTGKLFY